MFQNYRGELMLMREIKDEGAGVGAKLYSPTVDVSSKQFFSSGVRTRSSGKLRFQDRCDVVGLLCVRQASEDNVSKLANNATIYNEMLRRRPGLYALLCQLIPRSRFGEKAEGQHVAYNLPIFSVRDNKLTSHFSLAALAYIENAQMLTGARQLSDAEHEAIHVLLDLAPEHCFEMRCAPGDIQPLNNYIVYYGRAAFKDDVHRVKTGC